MTRPASWWPALADWVDAADPGKVRRHNATRATLAAFTAWIVLRGLAFLLSMGPRPQDSLFAVTVCFICAVVVVDARRTERRTTLFWSLPAWAGALVLAALLQPIPGAFSIVLLALIFAAYTGRRLGLRLGELALLYTIAFYFSTNAGATWEGLPWLLLAAGIGIGSLFLWQFVLLPYDPAQSLRDGVRSFYDRAAEVVAAIGANFAHPPDTLTSGTTSEALQRRLRRIKLSRSVIESQFPGVLAPGGWQRNQIERLQLALFAAERGLVLMSQGAGAPAQVAAIPSSLHEPLAAGIESLRQGLEAGGQDSLLDLAHEGEVLRQRVEALGTSAWQVNTGGSPVLTPWAADALRVVNGVRQVAASVTQVRALVTQAGIPSASLASGSEGEAAPPPRPAVPVRILGRFDVHPTTALGLQAVLATGLAMLVATLLQVDHANWAFWTAFSVIAGSSGESVRRLVMRVVGTVAGVVVGVALAVASPDSTWFVAVVAFGCVFLTIYYRPVSYPKMVFWLNLGFVIIYTHLGGQTADLLLSRPYVTLVGALVAAGVVLFLFPVSIAGRFQATGEQFLRAIDDYVTAFVTFATGQHGTDRLVPAQVKVEAAYEQLEHTFPSVAFENFPLAQADSPLTRQAQQLSALYLEVARLAPAAQDPSFAPAHDAAASALESWRERIHQAIQAAIPQLGVPRPLLQNLHSSGQPAVAQVDNNPVPPPVSDPTKQPDVEASSVLQAGGLQLLGIYTAVAQLVRQARASTTHIKR